MGILATSQITIVDLNDAISLQSYLTANVPKVQFVTSNGTYTPDYNTSPAVITAELYRLGNSENLITNNSKFVTKIEWFYKLSPSVEWKKIDLANESFNLGGTGPKYHSLSINENMMTLENPALAIKCEMTYQEDWMPEPHIQVSDIDFSITAQGDNGIDAYTSLLTNSTHSVICSPEGVPEEGEVGPGSRAQSDIIVYRGAKLLTAVGESATPGKGQFNYKITSTEGCSAARTDDDSFHITNFNSNNREVGSNSGRVVITINCENIQTVRQEMTLSKVFNGVNGEDGASASYVVISGTNIFRYENGYSNDPTPTSVTLSRFLFNTVGGEWQYYDESTWRDFSPAQTGETLNISHNMQGTLFESPDVKQMRIRYYVDTNVHDEITLVKLADGEDGQDGADGSDGYTVTLTNESHTVVCENNGTPSEGELEKAFTDVIVYKGISTVSDFTLEKGTLEDAPVGCDISIDNSQKRVTVTSLTEDSAKATIIINIDNKKFKKIFSITKSRKALNGTSAKAISITGPMAFSYESGAIVPSQESITLTATCTNFVGSAENITWTNAKTGVELGKGLTLKVEHNASGFVNNVLEVKAAYKEDESVFDVHTIVKVFDGKSSVTGYIWGPQGNVIKNESIASLPLEAVVFNGTSNVTTSSTFKWVKVTSSEGEQDLPSNTNSTINISADEIPNLLVIKCYMTYGETTIQDTIVLEDRMDPIQATIFSTAGDTFKNGTGETHLVARIIRNGEEIDSVSVVQSKPPSGGSGEIIYLTTDNQYYQWSGTSWTQIDTPEAGTNAYSKFKYTWYKYNELGIQVAEWKRKGKIVRVQSSEITQKASFVVEIED